MRKERTAEPVVPKRAEDVDSSDLGRDDTLQRLTYNLFVRHSDEVVKKAVDKSRRASPTGKNKRISENSISVQ